MGQWRGGNREVAILLSQGRSQKSGSVYSLDWITGLDYWTGLLD